MSTRRITKANFKSSGSKESLDSSETYSSSSETLASTREVIYDSTVTLHRVSPFEVYFLGPVREVNLGGSHQKDPDVQLIDKVEEAQLEGKLQLMPKDENIVMINISKYGINILDKSKEVLYRHPLHTIAQIVYYMDSFYKSTIILKVGLVGRSVFDCYVFQCFNDDQAQRMCQTVKDVMDVVTHFSQHSTRQSYHF